MAAGNGTGLRKYKAFLWSLGAGWTLAMAGLWLRVDLEALAYLVVAISAAPLGAFGVTNTGVHWAQAWQARKAGDEAGGAGP